MRIDELLRSRRDPVISFEFGPPRTVEAELAFWQAVEELRELEPAFVSVTYGAGGSTRELTLAIVRRLACEHGLVAMPHLTCVGATREELRALVAEIEASGAENLLALRGDPPRGAEGWTPPPGALGSAAELATLTAEATGLCIVGACYPEDPDLTAVRAKVAAGVSVLITQLFFDTADYFRLVAGLREAGIDVPVLPGIIPIASIAQVDRLTALCGATIPPALRRELDARAHDPAAVADFGVAYATAQCAELLAGGAPGLHFYTLNRSPATRAIVSALRAAGRWAPARGASPAIG
jgi:methylenetetrahydrofolate reductase (NADPH)